MDFRWLAHMARVAERGKLDALFFQDSVSVVGSGGLHGNAPFNVRSGRQGAYRAGERHRSLGRKYQPYRP